MNTVISQNHGETKWVNNTLTRIITAAKACTARSSVTRIFLSSLKVIRINELFVDDFGTAFAEGRVCRLHAWKSAEPFRIHLILALFYIRVN